MSNIRSLFELLTSEPGSTGGGGVVYDLAAVTEIATRMIDLDGGGYMAVLIREEWSVSFVVFDVVSGPATRGGVVVDGAKLGLVFHGRGPSGSLRELRHTYWGDRAGYIFYPRARVITAAFAALAEWYDCD